MPYYLNLLFLCTILRYCSSKILVDMTAQYETMGSLEHEVDLGCLSSFLIKHFFFLIKWVVEVI
jgi:hypothetical protein